MLTHPFINKAHDLPALLADTNKLSTFCSKLEKQSQLFPNRYDPDTYKGDGLELFVEVLLTQSQLDSRFGISQYTPILSGEDLGVDGVGVGTNGKVSTVQVKYRHNHQQMLTATNDHLSNFTSTSLMHYGVDAQDTNNMLVITTGKGLHHFTNDYMFDNKVRCIGYKQLQQIVDNNIPFWDSFRALTVDL